MLNLFDMKICTSIQELQHEIAAYRKQNKTIGFVPTMGALHTGHLSLVQKAKRMNSICVVSIFVNPTQFNDPRDLERYPRNLTQDAHFLESVECDLIFAPTVEEIYPEADKRVFDFGLLDKVMEGAFRPGHFNGVAQVVSRLFAIVQPDAAYFGEKDFQQLAIITALVEQLKLPIEIVRCPIIREKDGLAMSSRNALLGSEHRSAAPTIAKVLFAAVDRVCTMEVTPLKEWIQAQIDANPFLECEYVDIVDARTLQTVQNWSESNMIFVCVAVFAGKIRLIDNMRLV